MKTKKYHTVGTYQKSNRKMVERGKTNKCMTAHLHGLQQAL